MYEQVKAQEPELMERTGPDHPMRVKHAKLVADLEKELNRP